MPATILAKCKKNDGEYQLLGEQQRNDGLFSPMESATEEEDTERRINEYYSRPEVAAYCR